MEGFIMERKQIIKALGEHFGVDPKYMGVPSFTYQIETAEGTYTIDRAGKITTYEGNEVELETLLNGRIEEETVESTTFEVSVPMDGHSGTSLRNLVNIIYSKQNLIKKSLGLTINIIEDDFCIAVNKAKYETLEGFKTAIESLGEEHCPGIAFNFANKIITFKFFEGETSPEKIQAYTQFIELLNQSTKTLRHASAKANETDNDKFDFRVFLIRLSMVGDEYKVTRKVLLKNLEGNSAFKNGKPEKLVDKDAE